MYLRSEELAKFSVKRKKLATKRASTRSRGNSLGEGMMNDLGGVPARNQAR